MPELSSRQLINTLDGVRIALEPVSAAAPRAIDLAPSIRGLIENATRSRESFRSLLGPVEDLRRSTRVDNAGQIAAEFKRVSALNDQIRKSYRLPELTESFRSLQSQELQALWKTLDRSRESANAFQSAIARLTVPWLNATNALRSAAGFRELQGSGRLSRDAPAFDRGSADRQRLVLGDWPTSIDWSDWIFADPQARCEFYQHRGLDSALTGFLAEAFGRIVSSAGVKGPLPTRVPDYSPGRGDDNDELETGFARTKAAYGQILRFETYIRQFIERTMQADFGKDWIKQRVPPDIQSAWSKKKAMATDRGEPEHPLIDYADFTDYEKIILRKDNWRDVFAVIFTRRTLVQESFQRLYPIRVRTMHTRLVTLDDVLYLYVETKHLLSAMASRHDLPSGR